MGSRSISLLFACGIALGLCARAQGIEVTAQVSISGKTAAEQSKGAAIHKTAPSLADAVVWLTPLGPDTNRPSVGHPGPFRLVQKDKMFSPHLLVVPTGASVEFPNEDPFFHNVFSLFNGKRFDLGLYESGTTRTVRFDREGVSYIFCNIHPEMGAVVVALSTPYWGVSTGSGAVTIHNVPPGSYRVHVWSEAGRPTQADRKVQVSATAAHLGEIELEAAADPMAHHKNKFGEDYRPDRARSY